VHDVGRRIFGQYWWLIVLLVITGAAAASLSRIGGAMYTATARIALDAPDPNTRQGATAIADTARAIATSPGQVRVAIHAARVANRDPIEVADKHVSVVGLGSSAIVKVSVSDANRYVATKLANALAARITQVRTEVSGVPQQVADLDKQIEKLSADISEADVTIDGLNIDVANAISAKQANDLRARRDAASRQRDFLAQERGVLESERVQIVGDYAQHPKPTIISRAAVPLHDDSSGWLPYLVLGGLLGLIVGVGVAGLMETVRPSVVGGDALARELDMLLLGTLRGGLHETYAPQELAPIYGRLQLAAEAVGVHEVGLLAAISGVDLRGLASRLGAVADVGADVSFSEVALARGGAPGTSIGEGGILQRSPWARIRAFSLASPSSLDERDTTGLVLVCPTILKKAAVADINDLLRMTPMPLLGLITYRAARWPGRAGVEREAEVVVA
jgi:capsular polysaccharide biosynthesis protein